MNRDRTTIGNLTLSTHIVFLKVEVPHILLTLSGLWDSWVPKVEPSDPLGVDISFKITPLHFSSRRTSEKTLCFDGRGHLPRIFITSSSSWFSPTRISNTISLSDFFLCLTLLATQSHSSLKLKPSSYQSVVIPM